MNKPANVQQQARNPIAEIRQGFSAMRTEIEKVLPEHVSFEKFERTAMTAIQRNPELMKADRNTLFGACVDAAKDGLLPDNREGAMVTFRGRDGVKAQWMPMVAGIRKKVLQSGHIRALTAQVVYERDTFDYLLGDDEQIYHKPTLDPDRGKPVAAYAIATYRDGSKQREVMPVAEIERVRQASRSGSNGPWKDWWSEMARKTVLRRLAKQLPMSTDIEVVYRDDTMYDLDSGAREAETPAPQGRRSRRGGFQIAAPEPSAPALSAPEEPDAPGAAADDTEEERQPARQVNPDNGFPGDDEHDEGVKAYGLGVAYASNPYALDEAASQQQADSWAAGWVGARRAAQHREDG